MTSSSPWQPLGKGNINFIGFTARCADNRPSCKVKETVPCVGNHKLPDGSPWLNPSFGSSAVLMLSAWLSCCFARRHRKFQRRSASISRCAQIKDVLTVAEVAARAAGKIMAQKVGAEVIQTKGYAADLLTAVDTECEKVIREVVHVRYPDHNFLGEESAGSSDAMDAVLALPGWLWVVDPIDGTTNFVAGQPLSAVSVGVAHDGVLRAGVIYDPYHDEMFSGATGMGAMLNGKSMCVSTAQQLGEAVVASGAPPNPRSAAPCFRAMSLLSPPATRTVRILGSAAINFAWVACGRLDAWFEPDLNPWDSAAGAVLVQEAGGQVTDCKGVPYKLGTRPICASNGRFHKELLSVLETANATCLDIT